MRIIPAIDIMEGKCVRLNQGDFATSRAYSDDPVDVALRFEDAGMKFLHLVDLDGARAGTIRNYRLLEKIATRTGLRIDFGGGIAGEKEMKIAFECGAAQVNLGSIAVKKKEEVLESLKRYGSEALILTADVRDGKVRVDGWLTDTALDVLEFLEGYRESGFKYLCATDIASDGGLGGPGLDLYKKILDRFDTFSLIASGGVASLNDVEKLAALKGVDGVIVGRALYEGRIKLSDLKVMVC